MAKPQVDVIVEARMTSSRLPGKVMLPAAGKPLLEHMVERLRRIDPLSNVIIATTENPSDDCIIELADRLKIRSFRGDEIDVLGRVLKAAQHFGTDVIVEITGDDPLLDPKAASEVVQTYLDKEKEVDYVANDLEEGFPIGFNTRAFSTKILEFVERSTNHPVNREHVVNYICKRPDEFRLLNVKAQGLYHRPELRLTMDEPADYELIKSVFDALYPETPEFNALEIFEFLDENPEIRDLNKHVRQRTYRSV